MSFIGRLFGVYQHDEEDDFERDFNDPAAVKDAKKKKKQKPDRLPWDPLVPTDFSLLYEVQRSEQDKPDLWSVSEYRERIYRENRGQLTGDLDDIIAGRIRAGNVTLRLYAFLADGSVVGPAADEDSQAAVERFNAAYAAAKAKLAEASKSAKAKARAQREAAEAADEDAEHEQFVNDLVEQAKTLTFAEKQEMVAMFADELTKSDVRRIITAKSDQTPPSPPPEEDAATGSGGDDPFSEDGGTGSST